MKIFSLYGSIQKNLFPCGDDVCSYANLLRAMFASTSTSYLNKPPTEGPKDRRYDNQNSPIIVVLSTDTAPNQL
ncbi:unnamed protein product [Protopolystoma xenopodis]|uniref:Uncharacterized protein n=1 Tax=Protopolystoma xenopodis TaxID=117903 RepID=A0A3S5BTS8_9PLAT|nr:unnamed protein product [Protopolystoma xenopodis]